MTRFKSAINPVYFRGHAILMRTCRQKQDFTKRDYFDPSIDYFRNVVGPFRLYDLSASSVVRCCLVYDVVLAGLVGLLAKRPNSLPRRKRWMRSNSKSINPRLENSQSQENVAPFK
jgi:hypothetical protein